MVDPRHEAVLVRPKDGREPEDKTSKVVEYTSSQDGTTSVVYSSRREPYRYSAGKVLVLRDPRPIGLRPGARVEVDGSTWKNVSEALAFAGGGGQQWIRLFYFTADGREEYRTYPSVRVRIVENAGVSLAAVDVLGYLRSVVSRLPSDDPLPPVYGSLDFVHPDSSLARYASAAPLRARQRVPQMIFPFRRNLSQWQAVENALAFPISVIEGPPGTGKTETILNLIATLVLAGGTVGVVSLNNAAVENVWEKLEEAGFGDVVAALGNKEKRGAFFTAQAGGNQRVLLVAPPAVPEATHRLTQLDQQLRGLYVRERERAHLQGRVDAFRLEHQHFQQYLHRHQAPELEDLPLLHRSARRILEFLAETQVDAAGYRPALLRRIRRYFRYGRLHGLDAQDADVVLRLQDAFYIRRIDELQGQLDQVVEHLTHAGFDRLAEEHQLLSTEVLRSHLDERRLARPPGTYMSGDYRLGANFRRFVDDYPVLLSTCHSLRRSIADGYLLDYLVIDEASQVDLAVAAPALACARNVVVVGDLKQLAQIDTGAAAGLVPPSAAYDYSRHSILSSLTELYGAGLPRALLREHYRCDPAIIGFCNRMFYDDQLLPFTTSRGEHSMVVVPTVAGNHMRQHRDRGRSNQRELDVIVEEVRPRYCQGAADTDIGITTPYRRQVDKAADILDRHQTDTVHRFQGRQKKIVILSTVIDDTWRGRAGLKFVDDPRLVNVAVSRAVDRFILVTDHRLMPASRYLKDLIGYVRYQEPGTPLPESSVVSVFDLLYREYSDLLLPLARRLSGESAYPSENIIETLLAGLLEEQRYAHLIVGRQILLRNLLTDLGGLTQRQEAYVRHRASVDFVVYNRVTNEPVLALEVDGFAFHEDNPQQRARDRLKDEILQQHGLPLLRLPTTGSGEEERIRAALDRAEATRGRASAPSEPTLIDLRPAGQTPTVGPDRGERQRHPDRPPVGECGVDG